MNAWKHDDATSMRASRRVEPRRHIAMAGWHGHIGDRDAIGTYGQETTRPSSSAGDVEQHRRAGDERPRPPDRDRDRDDRRDRNPSPSLPGRSHPGNNSQNSNDASTA